MIKLEEIKECFQAQKTPTHKAVNLIARKFKKRLPNDLDEFIGFCKSLIESKNWINFKLMTIWIKEKEAYREEYFYLFEKWLYDYVDNWGDCDIYCYRVLNPMIEKYPKYFDHVKKWSKSNQVYVRRASAVCLLHSSQSFRVFVPFSWVNTIVEELKNDPHIHIKKGIGWLLKYSYLTYPEEVLTYLLDNKATLNRTTYRYAIEMMPNELKTKLMEK